MIQVPLDNLRKTRQYLAEKILEVVQVFYSERRVIQITNDNDPLQLRETIIINDVTPQGDLVNDLTVGEYDVIIGSAPARDSFDEVQFAEAISLRSAGVAIPDDAVVEYSHLAKKEELAKRIRTMTGQEPPSEEQAAVLQAQQQIQMQQIQLELQKMQAEVMKLQSEAELNAAKAQQQGLEPQLKVVDMQNKAKMNQDQLDLRRELSAASNQLRQLQGQQSQAAKIATAAMQYSDKGTPQPPQPEQE